MVTYEHLQHLPLMAVAVLVAPPEMIINTRSGCPEVRLGLTALQQLYPGPESRGLIDITEHLHSQIPLRRHHPNPGHPCFKN